MSPVSRLEEFVEAQNAVYPRVLRELRAGRKRSHWIWFIFPQLDGLGLSSMSHRFGIASRDEARSYLAHPTLGPRLRECVEILLATTETDIGAILGFPDDLKFRSCLTLFLAANPEEPIFLRALDRFYGGEKDPRTLELLGL